MNTEKLSLGLGVFGRVPAAAELRPSRRIAWTLVASGLDQEICTTLLTRKGALAA